MPLDNVKKIILVLSGKGGVGKSSVTTQLALTLSLQGHSVGVLDVDLTGPSIPRFFGCEGEKVQQAPGGLIPVQVHPAGSTTIPAVAKEKADKTNSTTETSTEEKQFSYGPLTCLSLAFILSSRSTAVIWRGPKKTAMVRQFLTSTLWAYTPPTATSSSTPPTPLDYLLIDTPPGTSDEHISLLETLLKETTSAQLAGAVVVTTPQAISISDVKKELNFCAKTGLRVLGVVENMAGYVCPCCGEVANVFSKGGGEVMAREFGVKFLGSVPLDPAFVALVEEGRRPVYEVIGAGGEENGDEQEEVEEEEKPREKDPGLLVEKYTSCSLYPVFEGIVKEVLADIASREGEV
ncbi:P-loop containing nucleoside triphosphate hydrolase protein [Aulographum hederae CBS 113979]|uniref:P-loop containing nucleoside triphosphate hydrolase protein n=1 Tax=Aulographum hederae CBS 113979 TaxID=1176131 RepID=A0A6G1HDN8_9PEZI|nr:P-loop containing nucleoside triphosphate hydrolase protein [Aulographum hederae CBS 113979]